MKENNTVDSNCGNTDSDDEIISLENSEAKSIAREIQKVMDLIQ